MWGLHPIQLLWDRDWQVTNLLGDTFTPHSLHSSYKNYPTAERLIHEGQLWADNLVADLFLLVVNNSAV